MLELLLNLDRAILIFLNSLDIKILDYLMILISFLGELSAIWLFFCLISLIFDRKKGKKITFLIILSLLLMLAFNFILDSLIFRTRPYYALENIRTIYNIPKDSSFPSWHTASAFISAFIFSKFYKKFKIPLYLFAILTAISRVYLAAHYPSDVLVGALEGIIIAKLIISMNKKLIKLK